MFWKFLFLIFGSYQGIHDHWTKEDKFTDEIKIGTTRKI
jgi:hypothetical protein